jgi:hypothetical protein
LLLPFPENANHRNKLSLLVTSRAPGISGSSHKVIAKFSFYLCTSPLASLSHLFLPILYNLAVLARFSSIAGFFASIITRFSFFTLYQEQQTMMKAQANKRRRFMTSGRYEYPPIPVGDQDNTVTLSDDAAWKMRVVPCKSFSITRHGFELLI